MLPGCSSIKALKRLRSGESRRCWENISVPPHPTPIVSPLPVSASSTWRELRVNFPLMFSSLMVRKARMDQLGGCGGWQKPLSRSQFSERGSWRQLPSCAEGTEAGAPLLRSLTEGLLPCFLEQMGLFQDLGLDVIFPVTVWGRPAKQLWVKKAVPKIPPGSPDTKRAITSLC